MLQTKFNTKLQMFFIKLNMIFFQKPPKMLNICIFPCTIRHLWFKYFLDVWGKFWHKSILQRYSKNHKIKMLFKTKKQNWNLNYLKRLTFQPSFLRSYRSCSNTIVFSNFEQKSTRGKKNMRKIIKNNLIKFIWMFFLLL